VKTSLTVAVVGATGAVGQEFLSLFTARQVPVGELRLLASSRSAGKRVAFEGREVEIGLLSAESFRGVDVAFFSAGATRSREFVPAAVEAGAVVIDNSSAFRMEPDVPLVVPEVNGRLVCAETRLIAVPNCTAIILTMAVAPLRSLGHIERLIVSTYQSASGGGAAMMELLKDQTAAVVGGPGYASLDLEPLTEPYAFNLFSHNTPIGNDGYNEEEQKVIAETRKILGQPNLRMSVTCVRVPVLRAHTESVIVEFSGPAPSEDDIRYVLEKSDGIELVDDRENNSFPTPLKATGKDDVLAGRIRHDAGNDHAICMLIAGDQLRKGAALNAVQIAEHAFGLRQKSV
jgi:aspartate-semialdehyde dehydrogenase